ncbi:MAG: polyisoprenoid-binding protein [Hyphococcus sp.]|nr:MAG: polyisoprenoid-binding protein [Marinicaulis sp.]
MRRIIFGLFALVLTTGSALAEPEAFEIDDEHSSVHVSWDYSGMVFPFLVFTKFQGTYLLDVENPENSTVDAVIPINSMWTSVDRMTKNLQSEWYFDVENHPTAQFKAASYEVTGENTGIMRGPLTIKGITHEAVFNVTMNHYGTHPLAEFRKSMDKDRIVAGFSAHAIISRADYEMTFVKTVGDEINIRIEAAFAQPKAATEQ